MVSVVVCGYDKYSVEWPAFFYGFRKYWSDCPWEKNFITNFYEVSSDFVAIRTGYETTWGSKVWKALQVIDTDIIFWLMEDHWLTGPVQTDVLLEFVKVMEEHPEIDFIRLTPPAYNDGSGKVVIEKELSKQTEFCEKLWYFKPDSVARATFNASFWRREVLLSYLRDDMTCWLAEEEISVLSGAKGKIHLCVVDPYIFPAPHWTNPYQMSKMEIVHSGRWTEAAYEYAEKEGLKIDFSRHPNGQLNREKEWENRKESKNVK